MGMLDFNQGRFEEYMRDIENEPFSRIWAAIYTSEPRSTINTLAAMKSEDGLSPVWRNRAIIALASKILTLGENEAAKKLLRSVNECAFEKNTTTNFYISLYNLLDQLTRDDKEKPKKEFQIPKGAALIGDSHTLSLSSAFGEKFQEIHYIPGTTLRLLSAKVETAQKHAIYRAMVAVSKCPSILFSFGEIDSRFIYSHSNAQRFSFERQYRVLEAGIDYLTDLLSPYQQGIIFSLPPVNEHMMRGFSEQQKEVSINAYSSYAEHFSDYIQSKGLIEIKHHANAFEYLVDHAHFSESYYSNLFTDHFGSYVDESVDRLD